MGDGGAVGGAGGSGARGAWALLGFCRDMCSALCQRLVVPVHVHPSCALFIQPDSCFQLFFSHCPIQYGKKSLETDLFVADCCACSRRSRSECTAHCRCIVAIVVGMYIFRWEGPGVGLGEGAGGWEVALGELLPR